ncbi:MAG: YdcH family protein [Desulfovibrionaceae bacterium]|nr:YdcH family protein [Desulfovibrionaceae bacterium]
MQPEQVQMLVDKYAAIDPEVKALWEEHVLFKKQIERLEAKVARSPAEEQEMKRIKKEKLEGKTKLYARLEALEAGQ